MLIRLQEHFYITNVLRSERNNSFKSFIDDQDTERVKIVRRKTVDHNDVNVGRKSPRLI